MGWQAATVSALHVLGVALSLATIFARARAFGAGDVEAAERADNGWGIAALLVLGTGIARLLWTEKGWMFYAAHWAFHAKMGLLGAVLLLEAMPMVLLMRWRIRGFRRVERGPVPTRFLSRISWFQFGLLLAIPFVAAAMARALAFPT